MIRLRRHADSRSSIFDMTLCSDIEIKFFQRLEQVAQAMGVVALEVGQAPVSAEGGAFGDGFLQGRREFVRLEIG